MSSKIGDELFSMASAMTKAQQSAHHYGRKAGQLDVIDEVYRVLKYSLEHAWTREQLFDGIKAVCDQHRDTP